MGVGAVRGGLTRMFFVAAALAFLSLPSAVIAQEKVVESVKRTVKSRVAPAYPPLAKRMNVVGKVKIEVTITADGRVKDTRIVGGSPVLVTAAIDAVKQWKFEPAAKDTTEIIEFEFKDPSS